MSGAKRGIGGQQQKQMKQHGKAVFISNNKVHGMTMSNKCLQYYGGQSHWQREGQGAGRPGYWKDSPHIYKVTENHAW